MASLVTREEWAQRYLQRGAIDVHEVEDILRWLASHCCILGSCVGSEYMGGQP
jgi:hypothetical protein